ncbi:MAG: amidohydrolase [SAR202 cluster bacterium]|nr:amidohydrolase [SAR202 cluster bacterium]
MRAIDIHAHMSPKAMFKVIDQGKEWYGMRLEKDKEGNHYLVNELQRTGPQGPKARFTPQQRIKDMDKLDVDVQMVSIAPALYNYHIKAADCLSMCKEVNDEIAGMAKDNPKRLAGVGTLPLQDVKLSIKELERCMKIGLKGAEVETNVNGSTWDDPKYLPLFKAAESLGALLFFHPANSLLLQERTRKYYLGNTIGNTAEDILAVAALIFGGVLGKCPNLRVCIAHGGGPACFGIGRMDRAWAARPEARVNILDKPSSYLRRMYYDCLTHSEAGLRLLIDTVGADHVVLGSDWPADMGLESPVQWVMDMKSLTKAEKERILWKNLEELLVV